MATSPETQCCRCERTAALRRRRVLSFLWKPAEGWKRSSDPLHLRYFRPQAPGRAKEAGRGKIWVCPDCRSDLDAFVRDGLLERAGHRFEGAQCVHCGMSDTFFWHFDSPCKPRLQPADLRNRLASDSRLKCSSCRKHPLLKKDDVIPQGPGFLGGSGPVAERMRAAGFIDLESAQQLVDLTVGDRAVRCPACDRIYCIDCVRQAQRVRSTEPGLGCPECARTLHAL